MHKLKWLYPGMGIKRWLALLILGIVAIASGVVVLFNTPVFSLFENKLLKILAPEARGSWIIGGLLIIEGILCLIVAIRCGVKSLISAIRPSDVPDLLEHVYQIRNLQKGPKIVTIGGGTGLSTMLRGLKIYSSNITAIVTVADDGGSSGRIRQELGILPPGDIRNTLIALAHTEPLMEKLFQYRFSWGEGLVGHSFGNLFIAAMTDITGDFEESIRAFSKVLAVSGRVLPSTLETVRLGAVYSDGSTLMGESQIVGTGKKIKRVFLEPGEVAALPEALEAIAEADVVILGPGSLYTSIIPNLLIPSIADALANTDASRVYICNVMSQPGETDGLSASEHVKTILDHVDHKDIIDCIMVNQARISQTQRKKYAEENAHPVRADLGAIRKMGLQVHTGDFLDRMDLVRHDGAKLARGIMQFIDS